MAFQERYIPSAADGNSFFWVKWFYPLIINFIFASQNI